MNRRKATENAPRFFTAREEWVSICGSEEDLGAVEDGDFVFFSRRGSAIGAQVLGVFKKNIFAMAFGIHPAIDERFGKGAVGVGRNFGTAGFQGENGAAVRGAFGVERFAALVLEGRRRGDVLGDEAEIESGSARAISRAFVARVVGIFMRDGTARGHDIGLNFGGLRRLGFVLEFGKSVLAPAFVRFTENSGREEIVIDRGEVELLRGDEGEALGWKIEVVCGRGGTN
jgi:hypothetical protein